MKWSGEALHSGFEFKALSCQPGAKYWEEVQMTQNKDTVGIWPICGGWGRSFQKYSISLSLIYARQLCFLISFPHDGTCV